MSYWLQPGLPSSRLQVYTLVICYYYDYYAYYYYYRSLTWKTVGPISLKLFGVTGVRQGVVVLEF